MNNIFWICFGIALTVFFPGLTDYAQTFMAGIVETVTAQSK